MSGVINWGILMIQPEAVQARHYFLEPINNPVCIWGIRILLIAGAIGAFVIYLKMKKKNGE